MTVELCCLAELRNGWHIISPVKSFTVYAATAMEKADWMMHVNRCIQDLHLRSTYLPILMSCSKHIRVVLDTSFYWLFFQVNMG